ncbi:neuronal acetylcholine receptor subunit alpha-2-like [Mytilus californianus]|uniref:neuronal acetylcholine receptor subunit alpha-2-like n=1 Tax=Mytilus californianus TaxID=6549 RepID=UPI00224649CD|nr:neuronal acetylcholine receptor subunit alpha-2-like [Mytilus californianus]
MGIFKTSVIDFMTFLLMFFGLIFIANGQWTAAGELEVRKQKLDSITYDRLVRPTETVAVKAALNLLSIDSLDTKSMTLTMTGWLTVDWTDSRLAWTVDGTLTADYFYALDTEIWKPELFIDNSKQDVKILNDAYLQFKVEKTGVVEWELPLIFQTHCEVDVTFYPFDKQSCSIELTSWAYTKEDLTLEALYEVIKTEDLQENGEWAVTGSEVKAKDLTETKASGSVKTYPVLEFVITLRRKPPYYVPGVILPVLLVAFLQILVFVLPVDSGEKIGFSITVLLALAVLLTLVTDSMPASAVHISYLSVYLAMTLVLGVFCVFATVLVIRINFRDDAVPVPKWVYKLIRGCCVPISCWRGCCKNSVSTKKVDDSISVSYDNNDDLLCWKDVSAVLDWFFFVLLLVLTTLLTLTFTLVLLIGGYT